MRYAKNGFFVHLHFLRSILSLWFADELWHVYRDLFHKPAKPSDNSSRPEFIVVPHHVNSSAE